MSRPVPAGHLVVVDLAEGSRVLASFHDEVEPRDVTAWLADLVLLGLGVREEQASGRSVEPAEAVKVATLRYDGNAADARVIYVHHPSSTAEPLSLNDAMEVASLGIAAQITAGVAHDVTADADFDDLLDDSPAPSEDDRPGEP